MKKAKTIMRWAVLLLIGSLFLPAIAAAASTQEEETAPGRKMAQQVTKWDGLWITADHTKHDALKKKFDSGPEVTKACLSCHSEAAAQFHETIHWTWADPATADSRLLGKGGLSINNF